MLKKFIPLFFSFIFLLMITAPTIVNLIDRENDIVELIGQNEEEEKGEEKLKNLEIKLINIEQNINNYEYISSNKLNEFYNKRYTKPLISLTLPPPKYLAI
ncbi:hypothetical protein [Urechidicola croceus]|uniref:Uncharacterized protein n=1 Tax=Urechidicola croceus TaxID=1850246 RepID=A0A1D8P9U4_9FLAO|nr:hypothetical protein [Urechidicola croceus]AOW21303.1 hypothetical protein LPB138_11710 [Urechidicola croceus]